MILTVTGFISVLSLLSEAVDAGVLLGSLEASLLEEPPLPQEPNSSMAARMALRARADLPMVLFIGKPP